MALNRKIRLPELPIFRKFSLALRQEFARPEEILQALEESRRQIRALSGEDSRDRADIARPRSPRLRAPQRPRQAGSDAKQSERADSSRPLRKDSVLEPPPSPAAEAEDEPPAGEATVAMPAAGSAAVESEAAKRSGRGKKPGSKRLSKKAASKTAPAGGAGSGVTPLNQGSASVDARKQDESRQGRRKGKGETSASEEEREFWGEERPSAKGRRGRAAGEKEDSAGVEIVRIGAEGKPVTGGSGSADEGDD